MISIFELLTMPKNELLGSAFKYLFTTNQSNSGPYHNLFHACTVTCAAYEMGIDENLQEIDLNELLVAAIMHDYGHSLGKQKDDRYNIIAAKNGILMWADQNKELIEKSNINIQNVLSIVDATQYPYVLAEEDLTIKQKIIRDADMCQIMQSNWLQQNILGLSEEIGIDPIDFLSKQKDFINGIVPRTTWFKCEFDKIKNYILRDLDAISNLVTDPIETK